MQLNDILNEARRINSVTEEDLIKIKSYNLNDKIAVTTNTKGETKEYYLDEGSESQMLGLLGIKVPITYLQKKFDINDKQRQLFPKSKTPKEIIGDLIDLGINHRQKQYKRIIYNKTNNAAMGILGRRYNRISNIDALEMAVEAYGTDIDPRFSYIRKNNMKVFFKSDYEDTAPISHEKILYGYTVGNSETGFASLSVQKGLTFLRCTNGMILNKIADRVSISHTREAILEKYRDAIGYFKLNRDILDMIDQWFTRPKIMTREELISDTGRNMIHEKLKVYGISNEDHRNEILRMLRENQEEENDINNFWIGNAVTDYASNRLNDPYQSNELLQSAYMLMTAV